ncbi:MAG: serine/threonine protein kinase [Deltaproteobacteria bacterium]|nr:serine/threonine protein kinase [Deltaproteobacteria bacterium]
MLAPVQPDHPIPRVTVRRRLAVGGMAELFLADEALEGGGTRPVVVKVLLPGARSAARTLFERERDALAAIRSPHVVRLLGSGRGYLLLEHVDGPDLATVLDHARRRGAPMPVGAAMAAVEGMLLGLADIHDATGPDGTPLRAIHRDVNPSNVLVSRDGEVRLADLGVVRLGATDAPTVDGMKGTLAYMAPEQLTGTRLDARTDLYAAGLVAYEALTGLPARPAGMVGIAELLAARAALPAQPSAVRPGLPEGLDAALLSALEPDPSRRPASARAMLGAFLAVPGAAPDRVALAALAAAADVQPGAIERTDVVGGFATRPDAEPDVFTPHARSGRSRRARVATWGIALAAAAAAGIAAIASLPGPAERAGPAPVLLAPRPAPAGEPAPATVPEVPRREAEVPILRPASPSRPPSLAPGLAGAARPGTDRADTARLPSRVLEVRAGGAAPQRTPLPGRDPVLVTIRGGPDGLPAAVVRLTRSGDRLSATIGTAPDAHFDAIRCNGRDLGESPAIGVRFDRRMECSVRTGEHAAAFTIAVVDR